jgi:hypothetical protein
MMNARHETFAVRCENPWIWWRIATNIAPRPWALDEGADEENRPDKWEARARAEVARTVCVFHQQYTVGCPACFWRAGYWRAPRRLNEPWGSAR